MNSICLGEKRTNQSLSRNTFETPVSETPLLRHRYTSAVVVVVSPEKSFIYVFYTGFACDSVLVLIKPDLMRSRVLQPRDGSNLS